MRIAFYLLFFSFSLFAQEKSKPPRRLFLEFGGNAGIYSVNYERDSKRYLPGILKWEAGIGIFPFGQRLYLQLPFSANFLFGKTAHQLELGTGQALMASIPDDTGPFFIRGTLHAGYRFTGKKVFFKIAYTPFYSWLINLQYEHWIGAGIGIKLKQKCGTCDTY